MELYYENSRKERVDLTKEPYLVKDMAELLDYTWKYDTEDEMITGFSRGICTITCRSIFMLIQRKNTGYGVMKCIRYLNMTS